jgi:hypothetical protein
MRRTKRLAASLFASGLLAVGVGAPAASAQPNIVVGPGGLVNVQIVDAVDIGDVTVQLPVSVAANVCDVDVAVLLAAIEDTGSATCTARGQSIVR